MSDTARAGRPGRLPVYYGWIIVAIAFVTTGLGVTARTAFSLMFPPIVEEFGWDRGLAAGAFSFGFLVSAAISPLVGRMMDRRGPRFVIELGVVALAAGLLAATTIQTAWQLYLYLGVLVGGGANCMTYTVQSQYLPNWFVRRRALAIGIAFSGVGVGALVLLPWLQALILDEGWRTACWALGVVVLVLLVPLNDPRTSACSPTATVAPPAAHGAPTSSMPTGWRWNGPWRGPCARRASGGSRWPSSAAASSGTPCRSIRPSTWSTSDSAPCRQPGRSGWSPSPAYPVRPCWARCRIASAANRYGR
jgi:MFS family permease